MAPYRILLIVSVLLGLGMPTFGLAADRKFVIERDNLEERHPELYQIARQGIRTSLRRFADMAGIKETDARTEEEVGNTRIHYVEYDLNGDGIPEVLFDLESMIFVGSSLDFPVEIFSRDKTGAWTWVGELSVYDSTVWGSPRKNGWAILKTRDWYYCWVPRAPKQENVTFGLKGINVGDGHYGECKNPEKSASKTVDKQ